mgnify:CR=1 FL=1
MTDSEDIGKCEIKGCGEVFRHVLNFNDHMKWHKKEEEFILKNCSECSKPVERKGFTKGYILCDACYKLSTGPFWRSMDLAKRLS